MTENGDRFGKRFQYRRSNQTIVAAIIGTFQFAPIFNLCFNFIHYETFIKPILLHRFLIYGSNSYNIMNSIFNLRKSILEKSCFEKKTDVTFLFAMYDVLRVYDVNVRVILKLNLKSDIELHSNGHLKKLSLNQFSNPSVFNR